MPATIFTFRIYSPLTRNIGRTAWYIDEFGAVLPLIAVLFAIYFWRRCGELTPSEAARLEPSLAVSPLLPGILLCARPPNLSRRHQWSTLQVPAPATAR